MRSKACTAAWLGAPLLNTDQNTRMLAHTYTHTTHGCAGNSPADTKRTSPAPQGHLPRHARHLSCTCSLSPPPSNPCAIHEGGSSPESVQSGRTTLVHGACGCVEVFAFFGMPRAILGMLVEHAGAVRTHCPGARCVWPGSYAHCCFVRGARGGGSACEHASTISIAETQMLSAQAISRVM
eukprot:scaffold252333_cov30-Tisochrysis_lutea.AAC.1